MEYPEASGPALVVRHTGQVFPLTQAPVTIGRHSDNVIVLSDPQVSRHHATISWQAGTYVVQDLGSANGTYIDERRIAAPQPLRHGSVLRLGNTIFDVQLVPVARQATATIAPSPFPDEYPASSAPPDRSTMLIFLGLLVAGIVVVGMAIVAILLLPILQGGKPEVVIQSPTEGAQIVSGHEITLAAAATGARDITRLELRVDDFLVTTATSPDSKGMPSLTVSQPWVFGQTGPHVVSAVAFTTRDRTSEPALVNVTVVDAVGQVTPTATPSPTGAAALPDLLVSQLKIDLETSGACNYTSTQLGVRVGVSNFGAADAGPFVVDVNGSQQTAAAGLGVGQTITMWFSGYVHPGENRVVVDVNNQVQESSEDNNTVSQVLPIPTLPPTCTPPPTGIPSDTPTPTPSNTPSPTPTGTNTPTPTPTLTPTPTETPTPVVLFWADEETITAGDSTFLHWHVEHVLEIYLDGMAVTGPDGHREVNPAVTTTYELRAVHAGGEETQLVTINVLPPAAVLVNFEAFPDGTPIGADIILNGDEFLGAGIWLEGAPGPISSCGGVATVPAIRRNQYGVLGNFLTTSRADSVIHCNFGPVGIRFTNPVRRVTLTFAGATDVYTMEAYDSADGFLGAATQNAEAYGGTFEVTLSSITATIARVTLGGPPGALTAVTQVYYER